MKHVRFIFLAVTAMIGVAFVAIAAAQDAPSANVEVRVWQSTRDAERLWISARPEGGSWATLGTIPLAMEGENRRGTLRYEDITLAVPVGSATRIVDDSAPCQEYVRSFATNIPELAIISCSGEQDSHGAWQTNGTLSWDGVEWHFRGAAWEGTWLTWTSTEGEHEACAVFQDWVHTKFENIRTVWECFVVGFIVTPYGIDDDEPYEFQWSASGVLSTTGGDDFRFRARVGYDGQVFGRTEFYRLGDPIYRE